ncbi:rhodanese-like domain-containing protein [Marinimicrococcus flavescens]|uniref:Rhodanese-like domain-containing protein n=1 Tax=Marinimicrococcus flavescens TaxID=3031815 RepID=A0AAP3UY03_9PROT|nr:rhodanese-like domain-containing protein [Marinimicrococcus flavescens]
MAERGEGTLREVDPATLRAWLEAGEVRLVDVRARDEYRRERIAGAVSVPPGELEARPQTAPADQRLVLMCSSGARSRQAGERLLAAGAGELCHLAGGLQAWKRAGLPVEGDAGAPLPLMRQVQIAAGSLALSGFLLGVLVSPWWHALSGFVGAGLLVAGITGFCGMARLLAVMPWNRASRRQATA